MDEEIPYQKEEDTFSKVASKPINESMNEQTIKTETIVKAEHKHEDKLIKPSYHL